MMQSAPSRAGVRALVALLLACTASFAGVAAAEEADKQKPINYSADQPFEANLNDKSGTLKGNVLITQGTTEIHADKVDLNQNADSSMSATAFGNPVTFRTKRDGADDYNQAYAQKIVYDGQTGIIELFGNAMLKQGQGDELRSNYMRYDMRNEKFLGVARPDAPGVVNGPGNRVRGVFMPRDTAATPAKGAPDAKGTKPAPPAKDAKPAATTKPATPAGAPSNPVPLTSDSELKSTQ
jgi:lipopolysaccharide export system protein LptA